MPRKSYKPEEIVAKLRRVDVLASQVQSIAEAIRSIGTALSKVMAAAVRVSHGRRHMRRLAELGRLC